MAFSATFSQTSLSCSRLSPSYPFSHPTRTNSLRPVSIRAVKSAEPDSDNKPTQNKKIKSEQDGSSSSSSSSSSSPPPSDAQSTATKTPLRPKKPVYSMKKGQIVRVDKEKYLNSVNYLSVGHPPYYKGLDYIYEDRGEVLDLRIFETGEYALIAWVGIPTAPAWLPTDMLIKSERLVYERM